MATTRAKQGRGGYLVTPHRKKSLDVNMRGRAVPTSVLSACPERIGRGVSSMVKVEDPRLLRQRLLRGSDTPEVLPGLGQRIDGGVIFVAAVQCFRVVRFNSRAVILRPVRNPQLPVVFL